MPTNVIMPQMGESIFEGTVTRWLKKVGDRVERDEPLFEISTDKVDAEIPSPAAGVLSQVLVKEGQTVQINTVVAVLDGEGGAAAPPAPAAAAAAVPAVSVETVKPAAQAAAGEDDERIRSSPLVRKLAQEYNVDLRQVTGTGAGGRISKQDILDYIAKRGEAPATAPPPAAPAPSAPAGRPAAPAAPSPVIGPGIYTGRYEIQPMSPMRAKIAERMALSKHTSAHVHTVYRVDMTHIARLREKFKEQFLAREGLKLTFTPFVLRAAVVALKQMPIINCSVDGHNIVYKKDINLGMAVALDWGLIVPVIRNAEEKNFLGLTRAAIDLAERARAKKLKPEEVQEGTFTVTNPGVFGALFGTPIINQPQVAILGMGNIHKTPLVIDDAIAIRTVMHLTLGYDHRVIDGAVADEYLSKVKDALEKWEEPVL
jgi:2-oxoglutarate dehydrogenase E2 component (dihydrolipoamide succinyltransferase)